MMVPEQIFLRRRHRLTVAVVGAAVAASVFGSSFMAYGQDQSAATPTDAIVARKTIMDALSDRMDRLEMLISSGKKIDLAAHAGFGSVAAQDDFLFVRVNGENLAKRHFFTDFATDALDTNGVARRDAILLTPGLNNGVHLPSKL